MDFTEIQALLTEELHILQHSIKESLEIDIPFVQDMCLHVLEGGKYMRPIVSILTSMALGVQGNKHISLAAAVELLHTASLLHDDVIDHSETRRGKKTAHTLWGNPSSILVGDYFYARASQRLAHITTQNFLPIMSDAFANIVEGELLQLGQIRNTHLKEADYFRIITAKTAKLFEASAHLGALITECPENIASDMADYGRHLGIAFQLIDDVIDYRSLSSTMGKTCGDDLAEGKMTLPLIYALAQGNKADIKTIKTAIKNGGNEQLFAVQAILVETGALDYTEKCAQSHADQAKNALSAIPDSPYKNAMRSLADLAVEREA
jgi:octaprenyl-diphosphate synthase